jgi:ferrous iron transport protein B
VVSHYPRRQLLNLERKEINSSFTKSHSDLKRLQQKETIKRYQFINDVLKQGLKVDSSVAKDFRSKLDRVLTHRIWGYAIFFTILFIIFQSIFEWSKFLWTLLIALLLL